MLTETAFLVLNALYLKKMANFAALVECVRLPEADVQEALNEAVKEGESRACANKACQVELRGNSQELWVAASEAVGGAVITHH